MTLCTTNFTKRPKRRTCYGPASPQPSSLFPMPTLCQFRKFLTDGYHKGPYFCRTLHLLGCESGELSESCARPGVPFTSECQGTGEYEFPTSFYRTFSRKLTVVKTSDSRRPLRKLKDFIKRCPSCLVNANLCSQPNGKLQPIRTVPRPFHTIKTDFILALPEIKAVTRCLDSY